MATSPAGMLTQRTRRVAVLVCPSSTVAARATKTTSSRSSSASRRARVRSCFLSKSTFTEECVNPCGSGQLLLEPSGNPRQCSPALPCPNTHWCHVGGSVDTTVCCSASECRLASSQASLFSVVCPTTRFPLTITAKSPCELPLAKGRGEDHLTRWYFNQSERKCLSFIYKGIGGNQVHNSSRESFRTCSSHLMTVALSALPMKIPADLASLCLSMVSPRSAVLKSAALEPTSATSEPTMRQTFAVLRVRPR